MSFDNLLLVDRHNGRSALLALLPFPIPASLIGPMAIPGVTFTRSTVKTANQNGIYVQAPIDTPVVETNGLSIEQPHTNQITNSDSPENWAGFNASITTNAGVGPDGLSNSARKLVEDNTNNAHQWYQTITTLLSTATTVSFTVKAAERTWCNITINSAGITRAYFDLANGVVGTVDNPTVNKAFIRALANGWYRVSLETKGIQAGATFCILCPTTGDATPSYLGNGTSGILVANMDAASSTNTAYTHSHVVTTTAAVTAAQDNAVMSAAVLPVAQGSVTIDITPRWSTIVAGSLTILDTRKSDQTAGFGLWVDSTERLNFQAQNATSVQSAALTWANGTRYTIKAVWGGSTVTLYVNGVQVAQSASATMPTAHTTLRLGTDYTSGNALDGWISNLKVFPS